MSDYKGYKPQDHWGKNKEKAAAAAAKRAEAERERGEELNGVDARHPRELNSTRDEEPRQAQGGKRRKTSKEVSSRRSISIPHEMLWCRSSERGLGFVMSCLTCDCST